MSKSYQLNALNNFSCIGSDCPDDCCSSWNIRLDDETYNKWQSLDGNDPVRGELINSITIKQDNGNDIIYLNRDENGHCHHLDKDKLCVIQRQLGEDMMPRGCREYPRLKYQRGEVQLSTALLSCPEMARLVLFSQHERVYTVSGKLPRPLGNELTGEKVSWYLEKTIDNVLAAKDISLNLKLTYLARCLAEIHISSSQGTLNEDLLGTFSTEYRLHMKRLKNAITNEGFKTNPTNARHMWHMVLSFLQAYPEFIASLGISDLIKELLDLHDRSTENHEIEDPFYDRICVHRQSARPYVEPYANTFNRYLQAVFVSKSVPWTAGLNELVEGFLSCTIPFAVIQMLSWLHSNRHQRLTENELTTIVYNVERMTDHRSDVLNIIRKNERLYRLDLYFDWFLEVT
jgi:hypothetical protein